jgi:SAM-dependent methyltransferase
MIAILIVASTAAWTGDFTQDSSNQIRPFVRATGLFKLVDSVGSHTVSVDIYQSVRSLAFDTSLFDHEDLVVFEENRRFVCAVGDNSVSLGHVKSAGRGHNGPRLIRRFLFLEPSTFVIDDEVHVSTSIDPIAWRLYSHTAPKIVGRRVVIDEGKTEIVCETLLPKRLTHTVRRASGQPHAELNAVELVPQGATNTVRFLQVFSVAARSDQALFRSELVERDQQVDLTIATRQRIFRMTLPPVNIGAGEITISDAEGRTLLDSRPLPSGVLPHGVEGVRLLQQWDANYRLGHPPFWDAGIPSGELRRVVEDGTIRACRVVELGCGSGTDAVYLASQGFDVTAIDIAPSALSQALQRAQKAGVHVKWLLADVLTPPQLDPFDFIYDRGCYHEVRAQNLPAYLETLRRLSRPGTRFILLAGNANEVLDYGPPRVTEEELRSDFSRLFDFEWLKPSRFEIARPGATGPLAWFALMSRKSDGHPTN